MSKPSNTTLSQLIQNFFCERLQAQQQVSPHTLASYRDTLRLLLAFVQEQTRRPPSQQTLSDWCAPMILRFLDHLEKDRGCQACTRNARLAALRAFMRYVTQQAPEALAWATQVLAIPLKRYDRHLVQPLSLMEVDFILESTDPITPSGRRDHLLFNLLYHTGARISEALQVRQQDIHWGPPPTLCLHGKGRRERIIPLLKPIAQELKQTLAQSPHEPTALLFQNRFGQPLTRWGVEKRLRQTVHRAALRCPSPQNRAISPHTFQRHRPAS